MNPANNGMLIGTITGTGADERGQFLTMFVEPTTYPRVYIDPAYAPEPERLMHEAEARTGHSAMVNIAMASHLDEETDVLTQWLVATGISDAPTIA